jgi:hypothetical protein
VEAKEKWVELAGDVGAVAAAAELGYPKAGSTVATWADKYGVELVLDDVELTVPPLDDDTIEDTLALLTHKIRERLTSELYVATPVGLKVQPLVGAELAQIAAAMERITTTHRLISGEATARIDHHHQLGPATARLLDRSLAASKARRALVIDTHGKALPA